MYPESEKAEAKIAPNYVTYDQMRNEVRYSEEEIRRLKDKLKFYSLEFSLTKRLSVKSWPKLLRKQQLQPKS